MTYGPISGFMNLYCLPRLSNIVPRGGLQNTFKCRAKAGMP